MPFDQTARLPEIAADAPAGPNLEFDAEFTEFERLAQGKPEQQYGATIVPAEEPEWKQVVERGWALLDRTHDLRIMATLAVARLQREGIAGFAGTLALIRRALEEQWEHVHPQLDPEDDNDPTLRANALLALAEPARVLRYLRLAPLARSARAGAVCWRDIAIANGTFAGPEDQPKMAEAVIAAAFCESDRDGLGSLRQTLSAAIADAAAIPAAFDQAAGYGTGPEFGELLRLLRDMLRMVEAYAPPEPVEAPPPAGEPDGPAQTGAPARSGAVSVAALGPVNTRADAMRLLDLVVEYYERNEPASPLPLLLSRARRLAGKGFLDLLRDLAPDGLSQAEKIAGPPENQ